MAIVSAAATLYGANEARKAGKEARAQGDREAAIEERTTDEALRLSREEEQRYMADLRTGTAASGVDVNSRSALEVASDAAGEFERQREFTSEVGGTRAAGFRAQGRSRQRQYNAQAVMGLVDGLMNAGSTARGAGSWWSLGS